MNPVNASTNDSGEAMSFRRDARSTEMYSSTFAPPVDQAPEAEPEDGAFRAMLDSAADGIYGLDLNGYVTYVNPAARRMTGWTMKDLRGRTQHSVVHHSHADGRMYEREDCPIYAALRDGQVHRRCDEVFWRKDGTSFAVAYTSSPIFSEGKPAGAVVIFQDLTTV